MSNIIDYLITGGTGLIGSAFIESLPKDTSIVVLSRQSEKKVKAQLGNNIEVISSLDLIPESSQIVRCLNLSGEPIVDKPWTAARKSQLLESRVGVTEQLAALSHRLDFPISVLISGSAIGFYPSSHDLSLDEASPRGEGFAADLCAQWESSALHVVSKRTCLLRTGIVLSPDGGMLGKLKLSFSLGAGATMGNAKQLMSWVHIADVVNIIHMLFDTDAASGPVNMVAPKPESNLAFSDLLAKSMHRPRLLNFPEAFVRLLFGKRAALLLDSQRVVPKTLTDLGYSFKYPTLEEALRSIYP